MFKKIRTVKITKPIPFTKLIPNVITLIGLIVGVSSIRFALDKNWAPLSPAEQNDFVNLMTQLLEKKGILSKEQSKTQGKKYLVKY